MGKKIIIICADILFWIFLIWYLEFVAIGAYDAAFIAVNVVCGGILFGTIFEMVINKKNKEEKNEKS